MCKYVDEVVDTDVSATELRNVVMEMFGINARGVKVHDMACRRPEANVGIIFPVGFSPWDFSCLFFTQYNRGYSVEKLLAAAMLHCIVDRLYNGMKRGWWSECVSNPQQCLESVVDKQLRDYELWRSFQLSFKCQHNPEEVYETISLKLMQNAEFIVKALAEEAKINIKGISKDTLLKLIKCIASSRGLRMMLCNGLPGAAAITKIVSQCRNPNNVVSIYCPPYLNIKARCSELIDKLLEIAPQCRSSVMSKGE